MPGITFNNKYYEIDQGESALERLLRSGLDMDYGCKAGSCQSCMLKLEKGTTNPESQASLSPSQLKLGYFLPCCCYPTEDIAVSSIAAINQAAEATVLDIERLTPTVVMLRLEKPFDFIAGQFISIHLDNGQTRSYSIASIPSDNYIELHIKRIAEGAFSQPAYDQLKKGDTLKISGPLGQCIYANESLEEPLLLAGIGTGLAPLYGVLRDALSQGHLGAIDLILGAKDPSSFYLVDELQSLSQKYPKLNLHLVAQSQARDTTIQADIYEYTANIIKSPQHHRIYLCGAASFVNKMRKQCFLAGAAMNKIHCDAFIPSGSS